MRRLRLRAPRADYYIALAFCRGRLGCAGVARACGAGGVVERQMVSGAPDRILRRFRRRSSRPPSAPRSSRGQAFGISPRRAGGEERWECCNARHDEEAGSDVRLDRTVDLPTTSVGRSSQASSGTEARIRSAISNRDSGSASGSSEISTVTTQPSSRSSDSSAPACRWFSWL